LLLVGGNPLPNYVSTLLLAAPKAEVRLFHTRKTLHVAERLQEQLGRERTDLQITPYEIDRADGAQIEAQVERYIRDVDRHSRIGLNYTGGTKPMSVHSFYALRQAFPDAVFSYLDAETLSLVLQRGHEPTKRVFVGQALDVSLGTVLALHDYQPTRGRQPVFPERLLPALLRVHSDRTGTRQWRTWLRTFGDKTQEPVLPDLATYPALDPVMQALDVLCDGAPTPDAVAHLLGFENGHFRSCAKALIGEWLEEWVYAAVQRFAQTLGLRTYLGVEPQRQGSAGQELDVLAISGYQLFALSCIVTSARGAAKEHLLEAYVRARQLGGDEARVALVSFYPRTGGLEQEINQDWGTEAQIRVFGPEHLDRLDEYLEQWIRQASRI
jgi:hypothetical protein